MKNNKKLIIIACFIAFGVLAGFLSIWYHRHYDLLFYFDLPGELLNVAFGSFLWDFLNDILSENVLHALSHVVPSTLAWGIMGILLAIFLKPKVIAWIMVVYFVLFGGFTLYISWPLF